MKFTDRVKEEMISKLKKDLSILEGKIQELNKKYIEKREGTQILQQDTNEFSRSKSEVEKKVLSKKELEDLKNIYEFVSNYPRIEKILDELKKVFPIETNSYIFYTDVYEDAVYQIVIALRIELYEILKDLNKKITQINDSDIKDLLDVNVDENEGMTEEKEPEGEKSHNVIGAIFSKIFRKKQNDETDSTSKDGKEEKEEVFDKYRRIIREFKNYYNKFFTIETPDQAIVDETLLKRNIFNINTILEAKRNNMEIEEEFEQMLNELQPIELWKELLNYYSNIRWASNVIKSFEKSIDRYELMYKEQPELFDLENLEGIFERNNQVVADLKSKKREVLNKNSELVTKKQSEKEIKEAINVLENKKKNIIQKLKKIEKAKTLQDLGYKSKEEAQKKLSIETKDHIVVPIPGNITNIMDLFKDEQEMKVEFNGRTLYTTYENDIVAGKINSIEKSNNENAVILFPIKNLKKEYIDSIKSGKINLNKLALQMENIIVILPNGRNIDFRDLKFEIKRYSKKDIKKQVEEFLGKDYVNGDEDIEIYDAFQDVPSISVAEKKAKREAVKKCLFENISGEISAEDKIMVNGEAYNLTEKDEKDLAKMESDEKQINKKELKATLTGIRTYLNTQAKSGIKIDEFYGRLLLEYMKVNRKTRAEYSEEEYTTISLKGKNFSIKPMLPARDKDVAKRYSRKTEDIAYKTMKLANLINKFAHTVENEALQKDLYEIKLDLVERVVDLSYNNPRIKITRQFDEKKMVKSVILEIPGYNMIALHVMNSNDTLRRKTNKLEENRKKIYNTSTILLPGVNEELLQELKNMPIEERIQAFLDLDSNTFYKLAIRMGYIVEDMSIEDKTKLIKRMVSDEKIEKLLQENKEDDYTR